MKQFKTGISTAYWTERNEKHKAQLCLGNKTPDHVSWFDELFKGAIEWSGDMQLAEKNQPITMLVKGPPGSGKTTFVLELCYRLSLHRERIRSTYISLESTGNQIFANADKYGWREASTNMQVMNKNRQSTSLVSICGSEFFNRLLTKKRLIVKDFIRSLTKLCSIELSEETINAIYGGNDIRRMSPQPDSQILVIDSLNIIPENIDKSLIFQEFLKVTKKVDCKIKLVIFILDGKTNENNNPFWEYMCDNVIELNHHEENNYYLRTIEIVKTRFQAHVLGKHQFKIYNINDPTENPQTVLRMHPVRKEGGIYIFPSIHYYLSTYGKFQQKGELQYEVTYPDELREFLSNSDEQNRQNALGGFPKGRCTALIGCRGGHKSHLAYLHILARLTRVDYRKNAALIISLRDDEKMIETTLNGILKNELTEKTLNGIFKNELTDENDGIQGFINDGHLEILYYPPGYISPEEFIHRIFISIHKLKRQVRTKDNQGNDVEGNVTLIFNSLDQLSARFPLCARFDMFIPSIIQILIGEGITSIFIAVDEKDQPAEQYGLLPMADLILSFHQYQMKPEQLEKIKKRADKEDANKKDEIILTVERFAGGKKAGDKGLLLKDQRIEFFRVPKDVYLEKDQLNK